MNRKLDDNVRSIYKSNAKSNSVSVNIPLKMALDYDLNAGDKVKFFPVDEKYLVLRKEK